MAWNEPGGGKKDPWSGGGGGGDGDGRGRGGGNQGPPDLDEVVRKLQERLGGLFGGKRRPGGTGGGGSGGGGLPLKGGAYGIGVIALIVVFLWGLTGFYIVDEGTRGVELRFGAYQRTTQPGPRWHIPFPFESVQIVDVEQQRFVEMGYRSSARTTNRGGAEGSVPHEALMLTEDENIVDVQLAVQYQVKNARDFLFKVREPELTLKQSAESALREAVGRTTMDYILTEGRSEIVARTKVLLQAILDQYVTGLQVTSVNMQKARPPQQVKDAFDDAIKAREDEQRLKNEAEAYAREVVPVARGSAARNLEDSNAYKARVIAEAEGEASRFEQLLTEYRKAPEVTRERLYLDAMEGVFTDTTKVLMDVDGGNNLIYLPLDKMVQRDGAAATTASGFAPGAQSGDQPATRGREGTRGRRTR
jgi:membrane protease subunit HflK